MTPPLCVRCGVRPVKRAKPCDTVPMGRGHRVVDGRHWRWHCSVGCSLRRPRAPQQCRVCPTWLTNDQIKHGNIVCSSRCAGLRQRVRPKALRTQWAKKAIAARQAKYVRRIVKGILVDCRSFRAELSREVLRAVVRVVLKYRRLGYVRGWSAKEARRRRALGMDDRKTA